MAEPVRAVQLTLLQLFGPGLIGTAYTGWLVQAAGFIQPGSSTWRVLRFRGDTADARTVAVPWAEIEAESEILRAFSDRALEVNAQFDTSDSWHSLDLSLVVDAAPARHLSLAMASSGFEGPDAPLLRRLLDFIEPRAGVRDR